MKRFRFSLFLTFLLLSSAAFAQNSPGPLPNESFGLYLEAPGPDVFADDILQKAIDKLAAEGGGTLILGRGDFKLSRKPGYETVVLKSNITLRGQGYSTHLYLDPDTPANPIRYYPIRIGTADTPESNIVIENLRFTGNNKHIGGGSIMGFNARLDEKDAELKSCDNITVHDCWIYDAQQAAGCTKRSVNRYSDPDRLAAQFKNWQVHHNLIDTCGNKAVELAECNGGLIADNYIINVDEGPQAIFGSRNIRICDNQVFYNHSGINITEGSNHITVTGNLVEPSPDINPGAHGPGLIFRTEPQKLVSSISHITVTGNVFRNQTTNNKLTVAFQTRKESLGCTYQAITMTGNVFDGVVSFLDTTTPDMTTIQDIIFAHNVCEDQLLNVPEERVSTRNIVVRGNMLRSSKSQTLAASQWIWLNNTHTASTLTITPDAKANVVKDNITASPIADEGDGTIADGNLSR